MPDDMERVNKQNGFTLIELAIALVILGILAGSFISTATKRLEKTRINDAKLELDIIKQSLLGFAYTNRRLPCPDCILGGVDCPGGTEKDGDEDQNIPNCSVGNNTGNIPWLTLGIDQGDAWSTHYRYWVNPTYADDGGFDLAAGAPDGIINERNVTGALMVQISNKVAAVIFSHGPNRFGGVDVASAVDLAVPPVANIDELENTDNDSVFVSRIATTEEAATAGGEFDDILVWISEIELKGSMVRAGRLPP